MRLWWNDDSVDIVYRLSIFAFTSHFMRNCFSLSTKLEYMKIELLFIVLWKSIGKSAGGGISI